MSLALDNEKSLTLLKKRLWEKIEQRGAEECWPWTAASDNHGRGRINVFGQVRVASQVLLILEGLPKPAAPNDCALHKADCLPSCMNPSHLRWGSQKENMQDKVKRGTSRHKAGTFLGSKSTLTEQDIRDIRASTLTLEEQAELYEISARSVWDIRKRRAWTWVE